MQYLTSFIQPMLLHAPLKSNSLRSLNWTIILHPESSQVLHTLRKAPSLVLEFVKKNLLLQFLFLLDCLSLNPSTNSLHSQLAVDTKPCHFFHNCVILNFKRAHLDAWSFCYFHVTVIFVFVVWDLNWISQRRLRGP